MKTKQEGLEQETVPRQLPTLPLPFLENLMFVPVILPMVLQILQVYASLVALHNYASHIL